MLHVGLAQVVDDEIIGTAQGCDLDPLHGAEVHRHVADVTGQRRAVAFGRDVEGLVDVCTIEQKRVEAVLTVNDIAAVAGVPDERVVASSQSRCVAATAAGDQIVAVAAQERVIAVAAGDRVIAGAAIDRELDEIGEAIAGSEDVVAAIHIENEVFSCADVEEERRRFGAIKTNAGAVGRNREIFCAVSAVDFGGIRAVAAFEKVAAVARIPDHPVIAGLAEHLVVAARRR